MKISVIGCGYLGAVHAACMAELGHEVVGVDVDPAKLEALSRGEAPFFEPGLPELLKRAMATGRLSFVAVPAAEELADVDVHFIAVGTPQSAEGKAADLTYVHAAVAQVLAAIPDGASPVIVGKSTVPVGTAQALAEQIEARALATAGVGVPLGTRVEQWHEVRSLAGIGDVVVKRPLGAGRGREVTMDVGEDPPFDGPYVVESFVPNDGLDRKLYVAGDAVFGLLKPSTLLVEHGGPAVPFQVDDMLGEVALRAAEAVGLHLCGIDVLLADRGPVVVDVNPFPGYRGLPGAPVAVVDHLLTHL